MESYNKERRKEIEEGNIQENLVIGSMDVQSFYPSIDPKTAAKEIGKMLKN